MYTKKLHFDAENHLPLSDLRYDQYPLCRGRKRAKNRRLSPVFTRAATDICRIGNRRKGGDSRHGFALISYTSLCSVINSWKPNLQHNFGFFGRKNVLNNPKMCSQLSFPPLMSQQSDVYTVFRTLSPATWRVLVISQIGEKEVILLVKMQLFRIYYIGVA